MLTAIADLLAETGTAQVVIGKATIDLTYYVLWEERRSEDEWDRIKKLKGRAYYLEVIPVLLASWDVADTEGQPIPLTPEGIEQQTPKVPTRFLRLCEEAVFADQAAGKGGAGSSPAGSTPAAG